MSESILLFDGVCKFCSATVRFVIIRDKHKRFRYAHLQSDFGKEQFSKLNIEGNDGLKTMILLMDGNAYIKSTAALKILKQLSWPWPIFYVFMIVPRFIRDAIYDFIGRHRYQWFGKTEECWLPSDEDKKRFID